MTNLSHSKNTAKVNGYRGLRLICLGPAYFSERFSYDYYKSEPTNSMACDFVHPCSIVGVECGP